MRKSKRQNAKRAGSPRPRAPSRRRSYQFYGWTPDEPDARDHHYAPPDLGTVPAKVSLRDAFPAAYRQGRLLCCVAHALAAAIRFDRARQRLPYSGLTPSRLFIYYNARALEGTQKRNMPCRIRNAIKAVAKLGACFEGTRAGRWPYVIARFDRKPPPACFKAAIKDRPLQYSRIARDIGHLRACLASGYPFLFGFMVYESIEAPRVFKTGAVPLPARHERKLGEHVVLAVGYDDTKRQILIRNSWGTTWGNGGYGTIPYDYVLNPNLARDFWTIRLMSGSDGQ